AAEEKLTLCYFLCYFTRMQCHAMSRKRQNLADSVNSHRRSTYQKVKDPANRKPIRGLWVRNGRFYGQLALTDPNSGQKSVRRVPIIDPDTGEPAATAAQARDLFHEIK